jgi:thiol:disulfide interchange protein DsbD
MFGLFDIRLPGSITRLGGGRRGPFGALVMGLTMGLVAAPCIGPFVVGLLAFVSASGDPVLGFWLFFVMAVGMGVPNLVLGIFSSALSSLPRSGEWLIYAKKVMGIGLLAVALYFVQPFLSDRVLGWTALLFALAAGVYLAVFERTRLAARWFVPLRVAVGAAIVLFGAWLSLPLVQARPEVEWAPYNQDSLDRALASARPVIIDFSADWCLPCRELERYTFTDPAVIEEAGRFALLKADLTEFESETVRQMRERFEVIGVPTIVFIDSRGEEHPDLRLYGFEPAEQFLVRMRQVH